MFELSDQELAEYIEVYDELVEDTLKEYLNGDQNDESHDYLWEVAQTVYHDSYRDVSIGALAEAAVHKERSEPIDWGYAKRRIVEHGHARSHDSVREFLPSYYASFAGDELVNHAVATDLAREL